MCHSLWDSGGQLYSNHHTYISTKLASQLATAIGLALSPLGLELQAYMDQTQARQVAAAIPTLVLMSAQQVLLYTLSHLSIPPFDIEFSP